MGGQVEAEAATPFGHPSKLEGKELERRGEKSERNYATADSCERPPNSLARCPPLSHRHRIKFNSRWMQLTHRASALRLVGAAKLWAPSLGRAWGPAGQLAAFSADWRWEQTSAAQVSRRPLLVTDNKAQQARRSVVRRGAELSLFRERAGPKSYLDSVLK